MVSSHIRFPSVSLYMLICLSLLPVLLTRHSVPLTGNNSWACTIHVAYTKGGPCFKSDELICSHFLESSNSDWSDTEFDDSPCVLRLERLLMQGTAIHMNWWTHACCASYLTIGNMRICKGSMRIYFTWAAMWTPSPSLLSLSSSSIPALASVALGRVVLSPLHWSWEAKMLGFKSLTGFCKLRMFHS